MTELQEQTIMRSMEYDNKYEDMKKKMADLVIRQELAEKYSGRQMMTLGNKQEHLEVIVNTYKDYVKDILNFSSVINHIVIQDEIDRQGTALFALKNNKKEQNPVPTFQLDPNCLNC